MGVRGRESGEGKRERGVGGCGIYIRGGKGNSIEKVGRKRAGVQRRE